MTDPGTHRTLATTRALLAIAAALAAHAAIAQEPIPAPVVPLPPPPRIDPLPPPPDAATPTLSDAFAAATIEVKVGQGRFLTFPEDLAQQGKPGSSFLAVGDPQVADFFPAGPRQVRLMGKRLGVTDFVATTASGKTYEYELRIVPDLPALDDQLRRLFPDAKLQLSSLRDKIVVEGQARDASEVVRILGVITGYVRQAQTVRVLGQTSNTQTEAAADEEAGLPGAPGIPDAAGALRFGGMRVDRAAGGMGGMQGMSSMGMGMGGSQQQPTAGQMSVNSIAMFQDQVINLIRVPTSQQVLLKVRVAELNRTAFRQIGADFLAAIPEFADLFGSQIGGSTLIPGAIGRSTFKPAGDPDARSLSLAQGATFFGTFSQARYSTVVTALRRNNLLKILAEPNLVTLNGHQANFLAGGQFPVPVNTGLGGGLGGGNVQVQFKEFGVRLAFLPIVEDGETIRLTVDPEVSSIDRTLGTTLVPGGLPVPGLNVRNSHSTVELRQGETLAIAGLLQLTLDGETDRIPGLGDLPYIGAFFSNTTSNRVEKELVILVTPYLVEAMKPGQVPPTPGDEVDQPNDLEFFFMNRIEGRTGVDARATTMYDDPLHLVRPALVERKYMNGPVGFSK